MAIREIKTVFAIDGERKYKDAIKAINKEQATLRAETRSMVSQYEASGDKQKSLTAQSESLTKQIELQKQKIAEAKNALEQASKIYGDSSNTTKEYRIQVANAETALVGLEKRLQTTSKQLALSKSELKEVGKSFQEVGEKVTAAGEKLDSIGNKMTLGVTAPLLAAAGYATKTAMDFESAFTGVIKTVDATEAEIANLKEGIKEMSKEVPSSAKDIAAVAEAAGQLGIETDSILGFTRAMIDLGEATNLSATEGASALAQFANITGMSQKDFDRLGSAIVALGNNSATTEASIVSMAQRLAGAGAQVGLTEAEIVAIAAAMASVGIEAEAGGSAMSKVMINMQLAAVKGGKELDNFAKVAGMSATEFSKAYRENAAGALTAFVDGLGRMEDRGGSAIQTLDEMGITEVRMRDALLRASGAGDLLAESIKLSSAAWEENNALTKEAELRYSTTESQVKLAKNQLDDAAITIGENLLPIVADMAEWIGTAAAAFGRMSPETQKTVMALLGVAAAIGPVTKTVGAMTTMVGKASTSIGKYIEKMAEKKAIELATTESTAGLASAVGGAGGLTSLLNPATLAIAGTAAAIGLIGLAVYAATEDTRKFNASVEASAGAAGEFVRGIDSAKSALDGFDESTIWTTENQQRLKEKVNEAQKGISEITSLAVEQRRAMTEEEYERLEKLIEQLGAFADGQIDAYQQKNRILQAMAASEGNMTEQRAQELIKAARENEEEIVKIAYTQLIKEYQIADEIRQNAEKLRLEGKEAQAKIEEQRVKDVEKKATEEYEKVISAERKKIADVISTVQQGYMDQNSVEVANLQRISEIEKEKQDLALKYNGYRAALRADDTIDARTKAAQMQTIYDSEMAEQRRLNEEIKAIFDDRTSEVAGAMAGMAMEIEFYGGKQKEEAKKATDGIITAYDALPKKSKNIITNAMQSMVDELKTRSQSLWESASEMAGGFISKIKDVLGIKSPSKVMQMIAENITGTTADTIRKNSGEVEQAAQDMARGVIERSQEMSSMGKMIARGQSMLQAAAYTAPKSTAEEKKAPAASAQAAALGDITIPVYLNGELVGKAKVTSEELARQEKMRLRALGVTV